MEQYSIADVIQILHTDVEKGLSLTEGQKRLETDGRNEMQSAGEKNLLESFLGQLKDPLIYVLLAAAAVSVVLKEISDAVIIGVVVLLNAVVGLIQEGRAKKALDALKKLTSPKAVVIRGGRRMEVPAADLVRGDLVCLEAGCQVPADMRLVETVNLKVEESALTGESLPMEKDSSFLAVQGKNLPLGDRKNMAYMSTIVTYGRGLGIVTSTGMQTELGKIATLITDAKEELTPLQKRLGELGKILSLLSLGLCTALFFLAMVQHRNVGEMLITAISLAVAAVPEGLPAVVTICLALSVTKLVKVNTIVRRLPSVETLGAVSVVCSDKTGTLTQNKMTVEKCFCQGTLLDAQDVDSRAFPEFFLCMVLCNDACLGAGNRETVGDPTELALLEFCRRSGLVQDELMVLHPKIDELPFDSDRKMMSTVHACKDGMQGDLKSWNGKAERPIVFTKGAPDEVLKRCSRMLRDGKPQRLLQEDRNAILTALKHLSGEALRTLAVAMKEHDAGESIREQDLIFLGLVAMKDPIRPEALQAVEDFRRAGVTTVMITGDHVDTAFAIGRQLGIVKHRDQCMTGEEMERLTKERLIDRLRDIRVFARVSPTQKVQIVEGFQNRGEIVAMTGDGVNDAPSLKKADIGIAMGKNGTDVARQAADMVLADDNFSTIRNAIEEGRGVYENIRKSVIFLLSSNLGEIITMFLAVALGLAAPLKACHILWINLITDSLPALALGVDKNDRESMMRQKPRKAKESLFARGGMVCTGFYGCLIAAVSLTAFLMLPCALLHVRGMEIQLSGLVMILQEKWVLAKAQTYAFTVLGMSQLWHAVGMRDCQKSVLFMNHLENKLMIVACVVGFLLQFAVTEIPVLIQAFGTAPLSGREWMRLTILAAMPVLAHEIFFLLYKWEESKKEN